MIKLACFFADMFADIFDSYCHRLAEPVVTKHFKKGILKVLGPEQGIVILVARSAFFYFPVFCHFFNFFP